MNKIVDLLIIMVVSLILLPSFTFAQSIGGGISFSGLMPLLLIFVFFYLFLIRPQHKKTKDLQKLLNSLKKDDRVITIGGVYGTVSSVKGNIIELKIADEVCIQIAKQSISNIITKEIEEKNITEMSEIIKK
jgi:preprotein translocase subunit YajC